MDSAEIIASALLQTTYAFFWPAFRRVVLFDLFPPKGSTSGFVVSPYVGPPTRQRPGAPITFDSQGTRPPPGAFEMLQIELVDLKLAETQASPALAILKLAWTQLGPSSLRIILSTRISGQLAANNVSLFRSFHDAITLLYPEAGEQKSWTDALLGMENKAQWLPRSEADRWFLEEYFVVHKEQRPVSYFRDEWVRRKKLENENFSPPNASNNLQQLIRKRQQKRQ